MVLSGYVQGKPYYLYKDGTAPPPSKAGRAALEAAGRRAMARGAARQQADCQAGGQDGAGVEPRGPLAQASAGAAPGQLPCSLRVGSPPGSPPDLLAGAARGSTCAASGTEQVGLVAAGGERGTDGRGRLREATASGDPLAAARLQAD